MRIERYREKDHFVLWNSFVQHARNSHFMFERNYMDYHSDRFDDHSLLIFKEDDSLISVMPANQKNNQLISHGGLSFGGFIIGNELKTVLMLEVFASVIQYLINIGKNQLLYKSIPNIYHQVLCDEDKYALFRNNATLFRRDVSIAIDLQVPFCFQERRKRGVKKAGKNGVLIKRTNRWSEYWLLLEQVLLVSHNVKPVHSLDQIVKLANLFPNNLHLLCAFIDDEIVAGIVVYETKTVAHAQYIAVSDQGKKMGALDKLFSDVIQDFYSHKNYFDFGISNEDDGRVLNIGLIEQKEGFGGFAVCHDFYCLDLKL